MGPRMTRGGKREGAGRPLGSSKPPVKRPVSVKLPIWLANWLKKREGSQARLIEKALIGFYGLRVPRKKKGG